MHMKFSMEKQMVTLSSSDLTRLAFAQSTFYKVAKYCEGEVAKSAKNAEDAITTALAIYHAEWSKLQAPKPELPRPLLDHIERPGVNQATSQAEHDESQALEVSGGVPF
jgi:hypothetical protein